MTTIRTPTMIAVFLLRVPASVLDTIAMTPSSIRKIPTRIVRMLCISPVATTSRRPTIASKAPTNMSEEPPSLDLIPLLSEDEPYIISITPANTTRMDIARDSRTIRTIPMSSIRIAVASGSLVGDTFSTSLPMPRALHSAFLIQPNR